MAFFYSTNIRLQSPKLPIFDYFHISILFLLLIPSANPLSFNFSGSDQSTRDIIRLEGHAAISYKDIDFTENLSINNASCGRASFKNPVHLYDNATGNLTDFSTNFSFSITRTDQEFLIAEGLAFFLAPSGSNLPVDSSGGALGLVRYSQMEDNTKNQIIAVEFDTFGNVFDPVPYSENLSRPMYHVGIDINSVKSVTTANWTSNDIGSGNITWVLINYNSSTKNLSVTWTYSDNPTSSLFYIIDLRKYLPEWVTIGFSSSTGQLKEITSVHSWNFYSSLEVEESNSTSEIPKASKTDKRGLIIGLVVGASSALIGVVWLVLWIKKKRDVTEEEDEMVLDDSMNDEFEQGTGPKRFLYSELARATDNFAEDQKLGEGGFGGVYKGVLSYLNLDIAVKRVSQKSKQGIKEYVSEVKIISRLRHKNLVQLVGWCHQRKEFVLVYEFMPNGSLDTHLFGRQALLTWERRYNIALGLASALFYLHEEWEQCVVHRDIKSSNVMLDSDFNAKLGDFGLARLVDHGKGSQTTVLAGTMGYMAPECVITGKSSKESDVYSYGIVALEIACGRRPIEPCVEASKIRLVEWVWELHGRGKILEAVDSGLLEMGFDEKQMECLMVVGLWCAHPDCNFRPSIRQAIQVLSFEAPLPTLPSKMPVPTYCAPPLMNVGDDSSGGLFSSAASPSTSLLYPR
ncbi:PREDICTED: L-type lectin-domain containing receptor kinase IX.1-like [Nelumbo nucifera]|uniref:non-specific serine/threonine protein kinase n=2 Tax=Nelumbo nucifera TaxID=4432 RepID=A0A1U8B391_NELNU|nr:PREDICTED: L-type lectin-domain containing receptor kinase IX.1-like [Nelumbo nucifera]DAD45410.1 TPA_asm: hypothetical protein HUJ06_003640 [Nelumbo nucifera]